MAKMKTAGDISLQKSLPQPTNKSSRPLTRDQLNVMAQGLDSHTKIEFAWQIYNLCMETRYQNKFWYRLVPPQKYCSNDAFVATEYSSLIPSGTQKNQVKRKTTSMVLKHGIHGVHYAIGWEGLFSLILKFGVLVDDDEGEKSAGFVNRKIAPNLIDFRAPPLNLSLDTFNPAPGSSVLSEAPNAEEKARTTLRISSTDTPASPLQKATILSKAKLTQKATRGMSSTDAPSLLQEATGLSEAKLIRKATQGIGSTKNAPGPSREAKQRATPQVDDEWAPKLKRAKKAARKMTAGKAPKPQSSSSTDNNSKTLRKQVSRPSPDNRIDWMVPPPDPITPPHPDSYETTDDEVYQEYLSKLAKIGAHSNPVPFPPAGNEKGLNPTQSDDAGSYFL